MSAARVPGYWYYGWSETDGHSFEHGHALWWEAFRSLVLDLSWIAGDLADSGLGNEYISTAQELNDKYNGDSDPRPIRINIRGNVHYLEQEPVAYGRYEQIMGV